MISYSHVQRKFSILPSFPITTAKLCFVSFDAIADLYFMYSVLRIDTFYCFIHVVMLDISIGCRTCMNANNKQPDDVSCEIQMSIYCVIKFQQQSKISRVRKSSPEAHLLINLKGTFSSLFIVSSFHFDLLFTSFITLCIMHLALSASSTLIEYCIFYVTLDFLD